MSCARMMAAISTPGLTPIAKLVYATLMGWASDTGASKTSFTALAEFLSCNRESVVCAIAKLTELGLISLLAKGSGHEPNLYQVTQYQGVVGKSNHRRSRKFQLVGNSNQLEIPTTIQPKQPVSEPRPRARVDSDSLFKKEEEDRTESLEQKTESNDRPKARAKRSRKPLLALPEDWQPSVEERQHALDLGVDPDRAAHEFRRYWLAEGTPKRDWQMTFRVRVETLAEQGRCRLIHKPTASQSAKPADNPWFFEPDYSRGAMAQ